MNKTVYALQTARKGSKTVKKKNILQINGKPLFLHNVLFCKESKFIKEVFVSTDDEYIIENSNKFKYKIIERPEYLAGDDACHHKTIKQGLEQIEKETGEQVDILVIVLGNSLGANTTDVDKAIQILLEDDSIDSVSSVSEFNMFNPLRAYQIDEKRFLKTFVEQTTIRNKTMKANINDKKAAGEIYFFNGSFWACRREAILSDSGMLPFPWVGKRSRALVQDNQMEVDAAWQLKVITE